MLTSDVTRCRRDAARHAALLRRAYAVMMSRDASFVACQTRRAADEYAQHATQHDNIIERTTPTTRKDKTPKNMMPIITIIYKHARPLSLSLINIDEVALPTLLRH